MLRRWVVNASPVITLAKIGRISLLEELCEELIIPGGVAKEINDGPTDDAARKWLRDKGTQFLQDVGIPNQTILRWDLGLGETEVLSWALEHPEYEAVVDDRAARNCASSLGVKVRGTIGVIVLGKRHKKVDHVTTILAQLVEAGFRIDEEIISAAKKLVGEDDA